MIRVRRCSFFVVVYLLALCCQSEDQETYTSSAPDSLKTNIRFKLLSTIPPEATASPSFSGPIRVEFNKSGNIYVLDAIRCNIQKYDQNWRLIGTFSRQGRGDDELLTPLDMALDERTGKIYVADAGNLRVQIFDYLGRHYGFIRPKPPHLVWGTVTEVECNHVGNLYLFLLIPYDDRLILYCNSQGQPLFAFSQEPRCKGKSLRQPGQLVAPNEGHLAIDGEGNIWCAYQFGCENRQYEVHKYSKQGKLLRVARQTIPGAEWIEPLRGEFRRLTSSLAIHRDRVFVVIPTYQRAGTAFRRAIDVFDLDGNFLQRAFIYASKKEQLPETITFDARGRMYSCSTYYDLRSDGRVKIYAVEFAGNETKRHSSENLQQN